MHRLAAHELKRYPVLAPCHGSGQDIRQVNVGQAEKYECKLYYATNRLYPQVDAGSLDKT